MVKSKMTRISKDLDTEIRRLQDELSREFNRPIPYVEATRLLASRKNMGFIIIKTRRRKL